MKELHEKVELHSRGFCTNCGAHYMQGEKHICFGRKEMSVAEYEVQNGNTPKDPKKVHPGSI